MIAVYPPWHLRQWWSRSLLLVVAWTATIGGFLFPSETSALQGRYLDSISPQPQQPSRLNYVTSSSLPNDGSDGNKLQMGDISPPPPPHSDMKNARESNDGVVDDDHHSQFPKTTTAAAVMGSYLDSLSQQHSISPSFPNDSSSNGGVPPSATADDDSESAQRNGGFVGDESFVMASRQEGAFDSSSLSSLDSSLIAEISDLSYVDWLAAQYQNPSIINGFSAPPVSSQQVTYSTFVMNGDGTLPQSTVGGPTSTQPSTMASDDDTNADGYGLPSTNNGGVPTTIHFSAAAATPTVQNDASDDEFSTIDDVAGKESISPVSISNAYFAVPRRPDDPPPLPNLLTPTQQSLLEFAAKHPPKSSLVVKEEPQQRKETPFFIGGVSNSPNDSNVSPNPLQRMIDSQLELINMRELLTPVGELLKDNVKVDGEYWKKQSRLMATGGVSLQGDIEGERKAPENLNTVGMTERIMKSIPVETQATGAGGASTWEAFQKAEANWARLKQYMPSRDDPTPPPFVTENRINGNVQCYQKLQEQKGKKLDYDIVICGGTLGIFFATALQLQGHRVCLVEAGKVRGREQEWNISMAELLLLKKLGILTQEDIDEAVKTEFLGCRAGFKNREIEVEGGYSDNGIGFECFAEGVLNLGVSPAILLERMSNTFKSLGGIIKEDTRLSGIAVDTDVGAALILGEGQDEPITARLVIDAMGNNSPITRQQRYGMKPDGVCVVVGSCASGFDATTNTIGDIIYTNTPIQKKGDSGGKMQYFWEAFPVGIGRDGRAPGTSDVKTTYMFTYIEADQRRPTLESLMEDYWRLLPQYQPSISNPETDLDVRRVLFAYFPTYRESPLQSQFSRILPVGDASGIQSPLSFGGFGALTRHLERITTAVTEAMDLDILNKENLAYINP
jgi:2-polyprenyl-6-methoxyphenol hydroxylase-like FAD-dependent oxidoreductase